MSDGPSPQPEGTHPVQWRARYIIWADVALDLGDYASPEALFVVRRASFDGASALHRILDVSIEPTADIRSAFLRSIELSDLFMDRVAIAGWASTHVDAFVSICPSVISVGHPFQMGTVDAVIDRSPIRVGPSDLVWSSPPEPKTAWQMARLVRTALASSSVTERWLSLYASLERLAEADTTERTSTRCTNCGHEAQGHPATAKFIRSTLSTFGVSQKDADAYRGLRGQVAHGSGRRTPDFVAKVTQAIGALEGHVLSLTAERLGAKIKRPNNVVVGQPLSVHTCVKLPDGRYSVTDSQWTGPATFPQASRCVDAADGHRVIHGVSQRPEGGPWIDPLAWPE